MLDLINVVYLCVVVSVSCAALGFAVWNIWSMKQKTKQVRSDMEKKELRAKIVQGLSVLYKDEKKFGATNWAAAFYLDYKNDYITYNRIAEVLQSDFSCRGWDWVNDIDYDIFAEHIGNLLGRFINTMKLLPVLTIDQVGEIYIRNIDQEDIV